MAANFATIEKIAFSGSKIAKIGPSYQNPSHKFRDLPTRNVFVGGIFLKVRNEVKLRPQKAAIFSKSGLAVLARLDQFSCTRKTSTFKLGCVSVILLATLFHLCIGVANNISGRL